MSELYWNPAGEGAPTLILAHGAGAPCDSPFMEDMAERLAGLGVSVCRFEFPYMRERRETGKKRPPNRQSELLECWREVVSQVRAQTAERVWLGGKSMGGRMAALVADEVEAAGVVCLGFPFHPPGKPEKSRADVLRELQTPALVVQGTRDKLGNADEVAGYDLPAHIRLHWLEDGDHDLKPRVRSGLTHEQHLQAAAQATAAFVSGGV